jgi:heptaprenyl diphosphate synthase
MGRENGAKRGSPARRAALMGVLLTLSLAASYAERAVPSPVPAVPGIKLGLANIVPLFILYTRGERAALGVNALRCVLAGLLFSGVWGALYALSGAAVSFAAMAPLRRARVFGVAGVSAAGGVCHNIGQLALAALVTRDARLWVYTPVIVVSGVAAGLIVGYLAGILIRRLGPAVISS